MDEKNLSINEGEINNLMLGKKKFREKV